MAHLEPHLSIDEVEATVLTLYRPDSSPKIISAAQASLSQLQSSPAAWSIARELLQRPDEHVRFYGILIIIVKLNSDSAALQDHDALELLGHLFEWYQSSLRHDNALLVVRKISSALATFFIHFHRLWPNFVSHLTLCLASGITCAPGAVSPGVDFDTQLHNLSVPQHRACLWVVTNIVDEAFKLDLNSEKNAGVYDVIRQNVTNAVSLMIRSFKQENALADLQEDALKCLQSLISFAHKASHHDHMVIETLRPLISIVIETVASETASEASTEALEELLSNHPNYLSQAHYSMLFDLFSSDWSHSRLQKLLQADSDFDSLLYGQLLIAFADAKMTSLMQSTSNESQTLLSSLCRLLTAEGYPGVDDRVFVPCVEFWSTFAETVVDEMQAEDESQPWVVSASGLVLQAVSYAWERVAFPPPEEFRQWDSSDRMGFSDARKDVVDLLQSVYALSGPRLVTDFSRLVLEALASSSWLKLEAAIFCICGLADCAKEDTRCDDALSSVFSSPLFAILQHRELGIQTRARQTAVSLVEHYTEYFRRNVAQIPSALNLLFNMVGEQSLTLTAAKSIYRLCSSCRSHLHSQTWVFLEQYRQLASQQRLDCVCGEKIIGAVACIAQAIPDEDTRLSACRQLVELVQENISQCLEVNRNTSAGPSLMCSPESRCVDDAEEERPALHLGLRALKFLVGIARGFKNPSDAVVDVDNDAVGSLETSLKLPDLQQNIVAIILQVQGMFSTEHQVTELICSVLRAGFSESQPNPFKLPPCDVAEYLTRHVTDTPRIGLLVKVACSFISSLHQHSTDRHEIISRVALWVIGLTRAMTGPESDPELTQVAIEFMSHLISKDALILFQLQPADAAEFFFFFSLKVLDGREPLPKMAASEFWTKFVAAKGMVDEAKNACEMAMNTLGPLLCQTLMRNIGGIASRSELDRLCEPLKRLVVRYSSAKNWLEAGLNEEFFPSAKVSTEEKYLFVKKLISLRGSRQTNQVVRDFWLLSRGSNFAYAS